MARVCDRYEDDLEDIPENARFLADFDAMRLKSQVVKMEATDWDYQSDGPLVEVPDPFDLPAAFAAFHARYGFPTDKRPRMEHVSGESDEARNERDMAWIDGERAFWNAIRDRCIADEVYPAGLGILHWHQGDHDQFLRAFAGYLKKYHAAKVRPYTTFGYRSALCGE